MTQSGLHPSPCFCEARRGDAYDFDIDLRDVSNAKLLPVTLRLTARVTYHAAKRTLASA